MRQESRVAKPKKRTYNLARIKRDYSYKVQEICKLFGIRKGTVWQWKRNGLPTIDDRRPYRFHGSELKEFLGKKQSARESHCKQDEFYCRPCRRPCRVWERQVDVILLNPMKLNLMGICEQCGRKIYRLYSTASLPEIAGTFVIQQLRNGHIAETLPPSLKHHLPMEPQT